MKAGWQEKPFEECIQNVTYTTKIQRKDFRANGKFPIISQEEAFVNGYWDNESDLFKVNFPIVLFGDHTKCLKYVEFDFVLGADGVKILPPCDFLEPKFFFYQLQTANLYSLGYARHYKLLKELHITYPNRREQQRIVAILDETFKQIAIACANTEKNLQNARALFESHLQSVFTQRGEGFVAKTFDEVLEIKNGKDQKPVEKAGGKYPIYGSAGNVMGWTDSYICDEQTTIIGRKGTINRPIFIDTKFWNVDTAFGLAAKPNLNAKFLYFFCLSYDFSLHNRGTTIPSLVKTDLLNIKISVPSLTVQEQLVEKFSALHKETQHLESIYQRKLTALDDLKKSLLHKAFAGEL